MRSNRTGGTIFPLSFHVKRKLGKNRKFRILRAKKACGWFGSDGLSPFMVALPPSPLYRSLRSFCSISGTPVFLSDMSHSAAPSGPLCVSAVCTAPVYAASRSPAMQKICMTLLPAGGVALSHIHALYRSNCDNVRRFARRLPAMHRHLVAA